MEIIPVRIVLAVKGADSIRPYDVPSLKTVLFYLVINQKLLIPSALLGIRQPRNGSCVDSHVKIGCKFICNLVGRDFDGFPERLLQQLIGTAVIQTDAGTP